LQAFAAQAVCINFPYQQFFVFGKVYAKALALRDIAGFAFE
jgi:hypothetical protein